ncbi:SDR family NAD(P)-dependent oxidoreductase [Chloroflexota bacterium]
MEKSISSLEGKVALITGGAQGIGRAIALKFGNAGADVIIDDRDNAVKEAEEVAEEIRRVGRRAVVVAANIRQPDEVEKLMKKVDEFGRIDILVNNAGTNPAMGPAIDCEEWVWDVIMDLNLKAAFRLSQRVAKMMVKQKSGCIINMASVEGVLPELDLVPYAVSKAGLIMMTQGMAKELGQYGIRVNAIAPGLILTRISEALWKNDEFRTERLNRTPLGRIGMPEDVANVALFLASEMADYVTGSTIAVDGGRLLY